MSNDFHLKRTSTGSLVFHYTASAHRLCRTGLIGRSLTTYPFCGAQVTNARYDDAATAAYAAMAVNVTYGNAPGAFVARSVLRADNNGGPVGTAEISVRELTMKWPHCKLYGSVTTAGNAAGTVNIATSATRLGDDPRTLTANVYTGDGSSLDGLSVLRYVYFWGLLDDPTPPGNYTFGKDFGVFSLTPLNFIV